MTDSIWNTIGAGVFGALIGAAGMIVAAIISRQPAMRAVVDDRVRVLLEHYERTIRELRGEIAQLESKVDFLTLELNKVRSGPHI